MRYMGIKAMKFVPTAHPISHSSENYSCEYGSMKYYFLCGVSGSATCGLSHTVMTPIDVLKCRIQADPEKYQNIRRGFTITVKEEGYRGLIRGWIPTLISSALPGLVKFGLYETFKGSMNEYLGEERAYYWRTYIYLISSATAEFFTVLPLCPLEALKVRIQTNQDYPNRTIAAARRMYIEEGIHGFYKGIIPLWAIQIPNSMLKFATYERTIEFLYKNVFLKKKDEYSKVEQLSVTFLGGYISGGVCAFATQPADVAISKINKDKMVTLKGVLKSIKFSQMFQGLLPRIFLVGTSSGIHWFLYDIAKVVLRIPRPPPPEKPESIRK